MRLRRFTSPRLLLCLNTTTYYLPTTRDTLYLYLRRRATPLLFRPLPRNGDGPSTLPLCTSIQHNAPFKFTSARAIRHRTGTGFIIKRVNAGWRRDIFAAPSTAAHNAPRGHVNVRTAGHDAALLSITEKYDGLDVVCVLRFHDCSLWLLGVHRRPTDVRLSSRRHATSCRHTLVERVGGIWNNLRQRAILAMTTQRLYFICGMADMADDAATTAGWLLRLRGRQRTKHQHTHRATRRLSAHSYSGSEGRCAHYLTVTGICISLPMRRNVTAGGDDNNSKQRASPLLANQQWRAWKSYASRRGRHLGLLGRVNRVAYLPQQHRT